MSITTSIVTSVDMSDLDAMILRFAGIEALIAKYADIAVNLMKSYARVDTAAMRDGIKAELEAWVANLSIGEGLPDARAVFNEYGTARMTAQPMMRPAMEQIAEPFFNDLRLLFGST